MDVAPRLAARSRAGLSRVSAGKSDAPGAGDGDGLGAGSLACHHPEKGYTSSSIVLTQRVLSDKEVVRCAEAPSTGADITLGRRHPAPGVEIIDCILEGSSLSRANNEAPSSRFISWWMSQPVIAVSIVWVFIVGLEKQWLFWVAMVVSALALIAIAATVPWGAFYLLRWIARGFARP